MPKKLKRAMKRTARKPSQKRKVLGLDPNVAAFNAVAAITAKYK
ncbi:MAG TPA: hypothetical protein VIJ19_10590 [Opitutaceae bacterium]